MGDDLMVDGFLHALDQLGVRSEGQLSSLCPLDISSQQKRFPAMQWIDSKQPSVWQSAVAQADVLIGLGATPFQLSSGDWLLQHLTDVLKVIPPEKEVFFVNVGAELEMLPKAKEFAAILNRVNRCSTRDSFSYSILEKLSVEPAKRLTIGADLANISLERLAGQTVADRKFPLGIVLGIDTLSRADKNAVRDFLKKTPGPIAFITGDYRDAVGFEFHLFKRWTRNWFSPLRKKLVLRRPDYGTCTMSELIQPLAECETILSSRFHGLLAAAWLGCKVAALGRSSKVVALAKELDIPYVEPPFDSNAIQALASQAVTVSPKRLKQLREKALEGILACKFW